MAQHCIVYFSVISRRGTTKCVYVLEHLAFIGNCPTVYYNPPVLVTKLQVLLPKTWKAIDRPPHDPYSCGAQVVNETHARCTVTGFLKKRRLSELRSPDPACPLSSWVHKCRLAKNTRRSGSKEARMQSTQGVETLLGMDTPRFSIGATFLAFFEWVVCEGSLK